MVGDWHKQQCYRCEINEKQAFESRYDLSNK